VFILKTPNPATRGGKNARKCAMPADTTLLPLELGRQPGTVTVLLFSQEGCSFCNTAREHYLRPMAATRPGRLVFAEVELGGRRTLLDWKGQSVSEADFARAHRAKFAPTVMFLDARGRELAPAIVGLSHDFFGAYLDARIATALATSR
jgi:hypothetical protein